MRRVSIGRVPARWSLIRVTDDESLEDAFRRIIRAGVEIPSARRGTTRFVGPHEAERNHGVVTRYVPMTVTCDLFRGREGNVVSRFECRLRPFVAEEHLVESGPTKHAGLSVRNSS
ncbi:hypothetical protein A2348_04925 [Candidatus Uhrbacteria bacterium RIFOXYB12_FULL_58_10]|uniref:Uncharacterized protein n=1 Tax=Candidatus Uhrbacteria bacterium RIFOXYB2_FULL_57_15 TaxID=1802422 RepID=A0A1F7W7N5_9BACT|nr:MAG: hypothetical protein A2348_04925 [Candidatus Uhrbacteria bacterium RIFOXYB12_FULL_58_10]OGL98812.1 MAG: hypothetical protein A2304_04950 [Candidatus Uhrbacteria bacterium RIFOXYB2_FULL_57_15]OGL99777.1 MAG: hypothetical protein A2501_04605 [Candidatus Uhrbacteria bacterium RIFOXYC12_FULL_57_11]